MSYGWNLLLLLFCSFKIWSKKIWIFEWRQIDHQVKGKQTEVNESHLESYWNVFLLSTFVFSAFFILLSLSKQSPLYFFPYKFTFPEMISSIIDIIKKKLIIISFTSCNWLTSKPVATCIQISHNGYMSKIILRFCMYMGILSCNLFE